MLHPGTEPYRVELLTDAPDPFQIDVVSRHELPGVLVAPFMGNWPDDAQPKQYGKRAEKVQRVELPGAAR